MTTKDNKVPDRASSLCISRRFCELCPWGQGENLFIKALPVNVKEGQGRVVRGPESLFSSWKHPVEGGVGRGGIRKKKKRRREGGGGEENVK